MTPRTVGILGGMGPEATILLQQKLMAAVPARDDADHIPLLIDMNPQVPSRIAHLIEGTGADPGPVLAQMARRLEAAGAHALAMPCNTAHHYLPAIRGASALPFLDIVALAAARAEAGTEPGQSVGMLASPAVRRTGLYDTALELFGRAALWPEDDAPLLAAIQAIKANGPSAESAQGLSAAAAGLSARGATLILVACSEFSLLTSAIRAPVPVIDTLDLLAQAIVQFSNGTSPE